MAAKKKTTGNRAPAAVLVNEREQGLIRLFPYQDEDITAPWRMMVALQCRQSGKTFGITTEALLVCSRVKHAHCVTLSASLRQGAMNIQKDAEVWRQVVDMMRRRSGQESGLPEREQQRVISPADDDKGRLLDVDAIAGLMETGKLETKIYWSNSASNYSRHQIFAANPDTARGATADFLSLDEFGTVEGFKEVVRAVRHMISRRPNARFKIKGTPPITSSHDSWEMLYDEATYTPNARGNWRQTNARVELGEQPVPVLRVDAYDAELAGVKSYDDVTGKEATIREIIEKSTDKEGEERERLLLFKSSGSAVIPYSCLSRAKRDTTGAGEALDLGVISGLNEIQSEEGLRVALRELVPMTWACALAPLRETGVGHDQSTTDKVGTSNPSSLTFIQEEGIFRHTRLIVRWLSRFPRVNDALIALLLHDLKGSGARMKGMGIDASNETFNAQRMQTMFSRILPVRLYKSGEKHPTKPGNWKDHLGGQYAQLFMDGLITLPASGNGRDAEWVLTDHSLAVKGPTGITNQSSRGNHGDTFDSGKLAAEELEAGAGMPEVYGASAGEVTTRRREETGDPEGFLIGREDEPGDFIS